MRKAQRIVVVLSLIIVAILIFAPPLIGLGIQKFITQNFILSNSSGNQFEIISYRRSWFSSDVKFRFKLNDANMRQLINSFGVIKNPLTNSIEFELSGHIQHGPVFYLPVQDLHRIFGLALMQSKVTILPKSKNVFSSLGISENSIAPNLVYISFTGKLLDKFRVDDVFVPMNGSDLRLASLQGSIWHWPFSPLLKGKLSAVNFSIQNTETFILLPNIIAQFDMKQDENGLWVGNQTLSLDEIILGDSDNQVYDFKGINFNSNLSEKNGMLDTEKNIHIAKFGTDYNSYGSFYLKMSLSRLNAKAISDMIAAYLDVAENGELYESQLKQRMFLILPSLLNPGTSFKLDALNINTSNGNLEMKANLFWPRDNFSVQSMDELIQSANLKANIRIATPLADQILSSIAKLIYIYQMPPSELEAAVHMQRDVKVSKKQLRSLIFYLTQNNQLQEVEASHLKQMIRRNISIDDFSDQIKQLILNKKISLETSYLLYWRYNLFLSQKKSFDDSLQHYQQEVNQQMHTDLNAFIQQGYVNEVDNNYIVSIVRENGVFKLNGQMIGS